MFEVNKAGSLKHGLKVGDETHMDFVLREPTTGDLLDAENDADVSKPLNYTAALLARQLVRIGSYEGPFTTSMIRRLHRVDFAMLMQAQREVDTAGEGEQHS